MMTAPASEPRAPTIVDVLARQALAIASQIAAVRATLDDGMVVTHAAVDALELQNNALLGTVHLFQDVEAQRRAAATARAGAEDAGPKMPPVFGRGPHTTVTEAPELPPVPPELSRS